MKLRWWKTKKELELELTAKILEKLKNEQAEAERERINREQQAIAEALEKQRLEDEARVKAEAELKSQQEPWVDIMGLVEDPVHGIKLSLDYNDAFVQYLKNNGFTGMDDDQIVQKWLAIISQEVSDRLELEAAEKTITGSVLE